MMWEIGNILPILMVSSKVTGRAVTFQQRSVCTFGKSQFNEVVPKQVLLKVQGYPSGSLPLTYIWDVLSPCPGQGKERACIQGDHGGRAPGLG